MLSLLLLVLPVSVGQGQTAARYVINPAISFVFMGACGPWAFKPDLHVTGRLLSLNETSDTLGVSCDPMFAHRASGSRVREIALSEGRGHGTFFQARSAWLKPAVAWAEGQDP